MFSEHKKKSISTDRPASKKEKKFDSLDEKLSNDVAKMNLKDGKSLKKYSPEGQPVNRKSLKKDGSSSSASLILRSNSKKGGIQRCSSDEMKDLGLGLFEAANVMCNIVDITQDSTMKRNRSGTAPESLANGSLHPKPIKSASKLSIGSQSSQSGPFAALKENAQKKKKSVDEDDE